MVEAATEVLGHKKKHQPDCFRENEDSLEPFFKRRNKLYSNWLSNNRNPDYKKYVKARKEAHKAVREAKYTWFRKKVDKAQRGRFGGIEVWRSIRDMQHACRSLIHQRNGNINGDPCTSKEEEQQRWKRHFASILNVESHFNPTELGKVNQRPMRPQLAELPSIEDLQKAISKIKNGKAGGSLGTLPEMVKIACQDSDIIRRLLKLTHAVWKEKRVPKDWADAILIPIPKKGDLSVCDNWRGISLLDGVGKVIARVLQDRLQQLAEEELPESQCGFRKGRGCTDMTCTVRQIVEKAWEHQAKIFILFIDLRKAYDSVPRQALWLALAKLGIPESTIQLVRSFHQDMQATVQLDGDSSDPIDVGNVLRQGCCMALVLFNLYTCLFAEYWRERF